MVTENDLNVSDGHAMQHKMMYHRNAHLKHL